MIARLSSSRLPRKALRLLGDRTLLSYVFDTLNHCACVSSVVLATSNDSSDDELVQYAVDRNIKYLRGSLSDVAGRFRAAIHSINEEAVFRVNGDSPLVNRELFDAAAKAYSDGSYDVITNVCPRTFPPGMSVELVRSSTYLNAYPQMTDPRDREHVTRFLYQQPQQFRIHNIESPVDHSQLRLAVDTLEDIATLGRLVGQLNRPHWDYSVSEIIELYQRALRDNESKSA